MLSPCEELSYRPNGGSDGGAPTTHQAPWGLSMWDPAGRPGPGGNYRPQIVNWIRSELSFMLLVTLEPAGTRGFGIGPLWLFSGT